MINGREIRLSNNKYMTDYEDAISAAAYFREKEIDALFVCSLIMVRRSCS